jgi:hypothetical protein
MREAASINECPVDSVKALNITINAGGQQLQSRTRCSSLGNCRECLRFTYQCRWCLDGEQRLPAYCT